MIEPAKFRNVLLNCTHFLVIAYSLFGFICYAAFGDEIDDLIILNLPLENWFYGLILLGYCVNLCITYAIQIYPCVSYIENRIKISMLEQN